MSRLYRISIYPVNDPSAELVAYVASIRGVEPTEAEELVRGGGVVLTTGDREVYNDARRGLSGLQAPLEMFTFDQDKRSALQGRVVASGSGMGNVKVTVRTGNARVDILLPRGRTNDAGGLVIEGFTDITDEYFDAGEPLNVQFELERDGGPLEILEATFDRDALRRGREAATITVRSDEPGESDHFRIHGYVGLENAGGVAGLTVRAFDRDLRSEQLLGEAVTGEGREPGKEGVYEITYTTDRFSRAEKGAADLEVRIYNAVGTRLEATAFPSGIIFNAGEEEEVNFELVQDALVEPSEYEQLVAELTPALDGVALADLTDKDIQFLSQDLQEDANRVRFVAEDARLARETSLPRAVLYGFARKDVGVNVVSHTDDEDETVEVKRIDLETLLENDPKDTLRPILISALGNLIPAHLSKRLDTIIARLDALREAAAIRQVESWDRRRFSGHLVVASGGEDVQLPFAGYSVEVRRGETVAWAEVAEPDADGYFEVGVPVAPSEEDSAEAEVVVYTPKGREVHRETVEVEEAQANPQTFEVDLPEPNVPGETVVLKENFSFSDETKEHLDELGIHTLANLRHIDPKVLKQLPADVTRDVYAAGELSLLGGTQDGSVDMGRKLLEAGYDDLSELAAGGPAKIAERTLLNEEEARRTWVTGRAMNGYLDLVEAANTISAQANGGATTTVRGGEAACTCEECASAVSPAAYLVDLIRYLTTHIERSESGSWTALTLHDLAQMLRQPLEELPASCAAAKQEVRVVRLCVEVLLRRLEGELQAVFGATDYSGYRRMAYNAMLGALGVTPKEIRTAVNDEEKRDQLAERLGLPKDHVPKLALGTEEEPPTEKELEAVFGLPALLEDAAGDPRFLDPLRFLEEGLPKGELLSWQQERLGALWLDQDHPLGPYAAEGRPIVEPDLIGPDDFRDLENSPAFELWQKRRQWLDGQIKTLLTAGSNGPDLASMLAAAAGSVEYSTDRGPFQAQPWPDSPDTSDLIARQRERSTGQEDANTWLEQHRMTAEELDQLAEFAGQAEALEPEEVLDAASILVNVQKRALYEEWRQEEERLNVFLEPDAFWIALREPEEGRWDAGLDEQRPLLDPDAVDPEDLPYQPGEAATLLEARSTKLEKVEDDLRAAFEQGGLEAAMTEALGSNPEEFIEETPEAIQSWGDFIDQVDADLKSLEQAEEQRAQKALRSLGVTEKEFKKLASLRALEQNTDAEPDPEVVTQALQTLRVAHKKTVLYPTWRSEEQGLTYWQMLRMRLPRWRAAREDRQAWQLALRFASAPPVVDPHQLRTGDFAQPAPGDPAYELWMQRLEEVRAQEQDLAATPLDTPQAFDEALQAWVGVRGDVLRGLAEQEGEGTDIRPRLGQLRLTRPAYQALVDVAELLEDDQTPDASLQRATRAILLHVWKEQQSGRWHRKERALSLALSPKWFAPSPEQPGSYLHDEESPERVWRFDRKRRRDWTRRLRARQDQLDAMRAALRAAVESAEEAALPVLRRGLMERVQALGETVEEKAEHLTKQHHLDFLTSACETTTRIGQILVGLQGIALDVRAGRHEEPELRLTIPAAQFERDWKWMGSYRTWKAAMGVFLFPENVLLPTLRRRRTPVFDQIVRDLRGPRPLTKERACKAAEDYSKYLQDLFTLKVEATCWAHVAASPAGCGEASSPERRKLLFMFGKGGETGTVYVSTFDPDAPAESAQSFWAPLDLGDRPDLTTIVGAVVYEPTPDAEERTLFLFLKRRSPGNSQNEVVFARYDLDGSGWRKGDTGLELEVVQLPDGMTRPNAVMVQREHVWQQPMLLLIQRDAEMYETAEMDSVTGEWVHRPLYHQHPGHAARNYLEHLRTGSSVHVAPSLGTYAFVGSRGDARPSIPLPIPYVRLDSDERKVVSVLEFSSEYGPSALVVFAQTNRSLHVLVYGEAMHLGSIPPVAAEKPYLYQLNAQIVSQGSAISWGGSFFTIDESNYGGICVIWNDGQGVRHASFGLQPELGTVLVGGRYQHNEFKVWRVEKYRDALRENDKAELEEYLSEEGYTQEDYSTYPIRGPGFSFLVPVWDIYTSDGNRNLSSGKLQTLIGEEPKFAIHTGGFLVGRTVAYNAVQNEQLIREIVDLERSTNRVRADRSSWRSVAPAIVVQQYVPEIVARTRIDSPESRYITGRVQYYVNEDASAYQRIYLEEAYYFLPIHLGLSLHRARAFAPALDWFRSLFDYHLDGTNRILTPHLGRDAASSIYTRPAAWLEDPTNPHVMAESRANAYKQFTLFAIARCLLDYADAEFTVDTRESVSRARALYTTARDLLEEELPHRDVCAALISELTFEEATQEVEPLWLRTRRELREIQHVRPLQQAVEEVRATLQETSAAPVERARNALEVALKVKGETRPPSWVSHILAEEAGRRRGRRAAVLQNDAATQTVSGLVEEVEHQFGPYLGAFGSGGGASGEAEPVTGESNGTAGGAVQPTYDEVVLDFTPRLSHAFCVPNNPTAEILRLRAEANLFKLRNCMNIAGMRRELEPYAAPTDAASALPTIGPGGGLRLGGMVRIQPTLYRFRTLIERAKQYAEMARQMEASLLQALERRDQEALALLQARQEVEMARAGVRLQDLRFREAERGVSLAELQQERAEIQAETYDEWINTGATALEQQLLAAYETLASDQRGLNDAMAFASLAQMAVTAATADWEKAGEVVFALGTNLMNTFIERDARNQLVGSELAVQRLTFEANLDRRMQEWELQLHLAEQDQRIGEEQVRLAQDRVRITQQERRMADTRVEQAREVVDFLEEKFTNRELYDWMAGVLEEVYGYFLQQATSLARLAEHQLAFERQEVPPSFIQADYWEVPSEDGSFAETGAETDRRGLTGSARLLQDVFRLDQYAFESRDRKLQLSKTFSLARLDPIAFEQFRETGTLVFETPEQLFDQDFPGHYLRLVRRVRTSVVALVPPTEGVKATLSTAGVSRVTLGGDVFQRTAIRRSPESVALTSPINDAGVFELASESDMLYPFEGSGVDTRWEFRLPRAANPINYASIADVLVTIDYTSLHDPLYRDQVIARMSSTATADRVFSFRSDFADGWYDLHNPDQLSEPFRLRFRVSRSDFPPNLQNISIRNAVLYVPGMEDRPLTVELRLKGENSPAYVGGTASTRQALLGMFRGNAAGWFPLMGASPVGEWELQLEDTPELRRQLNEERLRDIILVIGIEGERPAQV